MKLLKNRVTSHRFEQGPAISEEDIRDLIETVSMTPSSFNLQHWRIVAVTDEKVKAQLKPVSFNQDQVSDAAVTFVIFSDQLGHKLTQQVLDSSVASGVMTQEVADYWVQLSNNRYDNDPKERMLEAVRSGSMAAMALMAAVADKGWVSCPMIGFEPEGVRKLFGVEERFLPVMMVAVGRKPLPPYGRMTRFQVDEILGFNKFQAPKQIN